MIDLIIAVGKKDQFLGRRSLLWISVRLGIYIAPCVFSSPSLSPASLLPVGGLNTINGW